MTKQRNAFICLSLILPSHFEHTSLHPMAFNPSEIAFPSILNVDIAENKILDNAPVSCRGIVVTKMIAVPEEA